MTDMPALAERAEGYFRELQDRICRGLEEADGGARFREDRWVHASGSGGGATRVIAGGAILEKGGVNFSAVRSPLSQVLAG
jgi:coproporphyrinogen III oxidase